MAVNGFREWYTLNHESWNRNEKLFGYFITATKEIATYTVNVKIKHKQLYNIVV